jgi:hypothetical protein
MKRLADFLKERPFLSLTALFVASRLLLYQLFPFRMGFLSMLNQLFDINLLRTDFWNTLAQIHATPPLYNAFIGAILNAFPESAWPLAFHLVFGTLALGIVLLSYRILIFLKTPQWLAYAGALVMLANPIMFRFEIIPFYTVPLAFLILLSVFMLIKFTETKRVAYLIGFLLAPLIALLMRNFFHVIVFYIPLLVGTCVFVWHKERRLFAAALLVSAVFLMIGFIPNIKNQLEYGIFSSSTWQGMQLFSLTYFVPEEKIDALIDEGTVTPLAKLPRFQNPDIYYEYYGETPRSGNPAVNALYKSTGPQDANFNNWIYIQTAKEYGENTWAILARYPEYLIPRYINSMYIFFGFANYRYFDMTDEWLVFDGNALRRAYQVGKYFIQPAVFALLYAAVVWFLSARLWRAAMRKELFSNENVVLLYSLFLFLYVFGIATVVELGENYTARVPIDPLIIILAILLFLSINGKFRDVRVKKQ